ncbi:MOSC domain-containing protein [Streptomyces sp. NPDC031705]|uniref:MOSC domain-containing protein n=1 Tax=Streptomyces sp. NPDC031705 TaxID=3155729 RepID=UPI0033EDA7F1
MSTAEKTIETTVAATAGTTAGDTAETAAGRREGDGTRVARVAAVSSNPEYSFTKPNRESITLLAGLGVEGDVHAGVTVKHRSRVAQDPTRPNLRQVHLIHRELFEEVAGAGFSVSPGQLGENVTTEGIDLHALPTGTLLRMGQEAVVEVTGLRNPCPQINAFQDGLLKQVVGRDEEGRLVRKAGIMGVVRQGGTVRPGDPVEATLPPLPHVPLERV